jgi:hypothetical protein
VSLVALLILALVWAVFLVPQVVRARTERGPADSIGAFQRQLSVLERTTPGIGGGGSGSGSGQVAPFRPSSRSSLAPAAAPLALGFAVPTRGEVRKRRRDILLGLLAAMGGSLVLGLIPGLRVMLGLHLVLDVLFLGYVALLVRARNLAAERELKVRYLGHSAEPALLLRRAAN